MGCNGSKAQAHGRKRVISYFLARRGGIRNVSSVMCVVLYCKYVPDPVSSAKVSAVNSCVALTGDAAIRRAATVKNFISS